MRHESLSEAGQPEQGEGAQSQARQAQREALTAEHPRPGIEQQVVGRRVHEARLVQDVQDGRGRMRRPRLERCDQRRDRHGRGWPLREDDPAERGLERPGLVVRVAAQARPEQAHGREDQHASGHDPGNQALCSPREEGRS
jgi:hypothetical protein